METEYIYWRHRTPVGVKVEEVSGSQQRSGALWRAMALQVWKENGRDGYRDIEHTANGAPLLWGEHSRISISHTGHLLVVATLPPTPEVELGQFAERTALGIDAERSDRTQVLKVRERFMNDTELLIVPADDVPANVVAWTCKEALYKAALRPGLDWRSQMNITRLPVPDKDMGEAEVDTEQGKVKFILYTYTSGDYLVTIAITHHTATYSKEKTK